jgi:hypothetical protein
VLGLPWLDYEQASLQFGKSRVFTLIDGTSMEIETKYRRLECLIMSPSKVQKFKSKTRRSRGRDAEVYVINVKLLDARRSVEFHIGEEITAKERDNFR